MKENITTEKMVEVNGKLVPLSKRMAAVKFGEEIAAKKDASFAESRNRDIKEMKDAGWKPGDINLALNAQEAEVAASHGFIQVISSVHRTMERHVTPYGPGMMIH